jgi:hypothetical protein
MHINCDFTGAKLSSCRKININIITIYLIAQYFIGGIMKKLNINQFDEKEEEIADALISLGCAGTGKRLAPARS